ncbi:lipoprotein-releasing system ATP-binding protein [Desulfacinum infernum DSM 9756]|uniref:Lipoprotein-releasing system ATP-binding protein n=1 Tax=Desulfacinum infernum DSM 9756 TaxID=1121391 RepID=A0A1M4S873_9BACT|nr:ABC transporter ATP-binding protein [Desulfacinum infernum]SHE28390.1 lipoprotein-releasing system ATP-binding protein [Desulfacinum infernum DSM 9756]
MNNNHGAPEIHALGIAKVFNKGPQRVELFHDLELVVPKGQRLAIVGASGVGKSTLLHILGTLDRPTAGKVLFGGDDVYQWEDARLADFRNKHIGFVFQFHYLLPEFTALENVMMPGLIAGLPRKKIREKALALLERLQMEHRRDHRPSELSGGEQQRVAIARALVLDPPVLLADEPTGNLDTKTARSFHDLLVSLNEELHVTMIVVTHNQELASIMHRTLHLSDGQLRPV